MMAVCVLAGAIGWTLSADSFTLAWTHSVEKVRWEEDYRLEGKMLVLESARVRGSGAGMEPPADAVWRNGAWHYKPTGANTPRLSLANSPFGGQYELCAGGECRRLPVNTTASREGAVIEVCEREE